MEVYLELKGLIDTAKERERIEKAKAALEKEIARTSGKLNNKGFLAKAPEDVVAKEKEKLAEFEEKMKSLMNVFVSLPIFNCCCIKESV